MTLGTLKNGKKKPSPSSKTNLVFGVELLKNSFHTTPRKGEGTLTMNTWTLTNTAEQKTAQNSFSAPNAISWKTNTSNSALNAKLTITNPNVDVNYYVQNVSSKPRLDKKQKPITTNTQKN